MRSREVTRGDLQRALVINAATKPTAIGVGAAVAVGGLLLGATWLVAVAIVVYLALAALTFFDGDEAEKVGDRVYGRVRAGAEPRKQLETKDLAPPIRDQVIRARREAKTVRDTIAGASLSFSEVAGEVDGLVTAIETIARRAQRIWSYLTAQDVAGLDRRLAQLESAGGVPQTTVIAALREQRAALEELGDVMNRSLAEMEQVNAQLGGINARLVRLAVAEEEAGEHALAGDVRDLRDRLEATAAGLEEAYGAAPSS
ncbi:MAG: hypothetical protein JHC95_11500 [Solirubrobacteraceae bacterium]|nr:hypothetical protein [Solirubrobacteraceae bacterium]